MINFLVEAKERNGTEMTDNALLKRGPARHIHVRQVRGDSTDLSRRRGPPRRRRRPRTMSAKAGTHWTW